MALSERIAAMLVGEAGAAARLWVAGTLPATVHAALPDGCQVLMVDPAGSDGPPPEHADAAPTAVLMLDDARPDDDTERRLGTACRRFPGRVIVWQRDAEGHAPLPATRFFAHGFRRLLVDDEGDVRHAVYEYRLADYKRAPDWLNARFWANPERFSLPD